MRIAFTADEPKGLDSVISYHFGRCPYFVIVELDGRDVKKVENVDNPSAESHAAGELPQLMNQLGVNAIVTGGMGPKAQEYFAQYGIQPITGAYGKVRDVLEEIIEGTLRERPPLAEEHVPHVRGRTRKSDA